MITSKDIKFSTITFSGGELHVQIESMADQPVYSIDLTIRNSEDIMEYLLLDNAIYHFKNSRALIELHIDYMPYARQDRVCAPGQAFGLEVMAGLLNNLKCVTSIHSKDVHSKVAEKLFNDISWITQFALLRELPIDMKDIDYIMAPDMGALDKLAEYNTAIPLGYATKIRNPSTGEISHTEITHPPAEKIKDRVFLIPDDICDGGRTFVEIAKILKAKGAKKVILYVTHGIFSKGLGVFDDLIDEVYCHNSIAPNKIIFDNLQFKTKLTVINKEYGYEPAS